MNVVCAGCGRLLAVPPDKAAIPNLKARCHCGHVFVVAEAARAPESGAGPAPASAAPQQPLRPSVAPATPAPQPAAPASPARPAPTPARSIAAVGASATAPAAHAGRPATRPVPAAAAWRRCANHADQPSRYVCPGCSRGYCPDCVQVVQGGAICAPCDRLCIPAEKWDAHRRVERERARSLIEDVGVIFSYPLRDRFGFVILVIFTYVFSFIFALLSTGVLLWYTFHALGKVAAGKLDEFAPDFTDIGDLARPAVLSLAVSLISFGPLFVVVYFAPEAPLDALRRSRAASQVEVVTAQPAPADDADTPPVATEDSEPSADAPPPEPYVEEPAPALLPWLAALGAALLWGVLYAPVALVVAALSRSFLSTLNPLVGIDTVRRMGATYWQALALYFAILIAQTIVGFPLGFIPFAGGLLRAFLDAYAGLAIACALGLAVYKKAAELGWD